VQYAAPLSAELLAVQPFVSSKNPAYRSAGYTRQLYDTFFADRWLPHGAQPDDLIGILDADSALLAVLAPSALLEHGMLRRPFLVGKGEAYLGDKHFLGPGTPQRYNVMYTDAMPQLSFVGTLAAVRDGVAAAAGPNATFDSAWLRLGEQRGVQRRISPACIIFEFAAAHDAARYEAVAVPGESGVPIFASNHPPGGARAVRPGCCRAFRLPTCTAEDLADASHLSYVKQAPKGAWPLAEQVRVADATYVHIEALLAQLPAADRNSMRGACAAAMGGG